MIPAEALSSGGVEVIASSVKVLPTEHRRTIGAEITLRPIGLPSDPTFLHHAFAVEVVPAAADLLLPAHALARHRVDVVGLAAGLLPTGQALAVGTVDALQPVGLPGEQTRVHGRVAVEIVGLAINHMIPAEALSRSGIEVIALSPKILPTEHRRAVRSEVALRPVGLPGDPTFLHHALAVEVVPLISNLLAPSYGVTPGIEIVPLPSDRPPIRLHERTVAVRILDEASFGLQTRDNRLSGLNRRRRLFQLIVFGIRRSISILCTFFGSIRRVRRI